jgi:hypothetical protein
MTDQQPDEFFAVTSRRGLSNLLSQRERQHLHTYTFDVIKRGHSLLFVISLIYFCDIFHKVILNFLNLSKEIPKCNVLVTRRVSGTFRDMTLGISANSFQIPNIPYSFVRGRSAVR